MKVPFERTSYATVLLLVAVVVLAIVAGVAMVRACDGVWVTDFVGIPRCVEKAR